MEISIGMQKTVRLGAVFSKSFRAFGRRAIIFIIISAIAHLPGYLWSSSVADEFVAASALPWADWLVPLVGVTCVMIGYGAIIHDVLQEASRPAAITEAVGRRSIKDGVHLVKIFN